MSDNQQTEQGDGFAVTIDSTSMPTDQPAVSVTRRAAPQIKFGTSGKAGFSGETARLLRSRLVAYSLISFCIMGFGFVAVLFDEMPMVPMRFAVLMVLAASYLICRSDRELSLTQLRWIEAATFGSILIQIVLMSWLRIETPAMRGDIGQSLLATQFLFTVVCLAIFTYGIFIPNSWRRATLVLLPVAAIPDVVMMLLRSVNPEVDAINQAVQLSKPVPETVVAASIAIYGSHVIQGVRREAFKAKQLGQYVLKGLLGTGGMGEVYRAEHRMLKRPCAIKLIHATAETDEKAIDRFEQEVRSTAKLSHWNSVEVYDYGRTDDGTFYYVMELLPGANLEDIVKKTGAMSVSRAIHLLMQLCDALHEAHGQGLVHRDIKPANVFASRRGGVHDVAKLLDFGLVRQASDDSGARTGFAGTPSYMPPEQATDYDNVDGRADIYALGAVGFFLMTGRPPFQDKKVAKLLLMHRRDPVPSLREINPQVTEDFERIIKKCLEKSPGDRYQNVAQLREDLLACNDAMEWTEPRAVDWWMSHRAVMDRPESCQSDATETSAMQGSETQEVTEDYSGPQAAD